MRQTWYLSSFQD